MALFLPQMTGTLHRFSAHDLYGVATYAGARQVGVGIVRLSSGVVRSSVRADSSASRGRSEEPQILGEVLLEAAANPGPDDKLVLRNISYRVISAEPRFDLLGNVAHHQVVLGALEG